MFFNRGAFVLIALCAFGAIQASFEAKNGTVVDNLADGSLVWPLHGNQSHPHHPSGPHGNQSHPHHPGHSNSSHPSGPHGNQSHPHHPHHTGHSNSSHPHLPPGNSSRPLRPGHFNSSHYGYPSRNNAFISRRKNSRYPPHQPGFGFRPRPIRRRSERSIESEKQVEEIPQQRGFFSSLKKIFKPSSVYRPMTHVSVYQPVYRPSYQPIYRPAYNASWYRPANNSWSQLG